jgi:glutathione synthase/RimK-type ligase-like ATP-grasp enzyme
MALLFVVENPKQWPLQIPGTRIVPARDYLTQPEFIDLRRAKVFNLCRTYGYQTVGYYVSLLAAARGHKPLPSVTTIQDLRMSSVIRIVSEDLEATIQRVLQPLRSPHFELSIYFGRNMAKRYDRLCQALFNHFPAPLLRAEFIFADQWRLHSLRPIASSDVPEPHWEFVVDQARRFFQRPYVNDPKPARYELAILVNGDEVDAPSDARAIQRFMKAARRLGMHPTLIGKEDFGRIAEFDALFIRETTYVNHHTYRFASRAEAEGLVVIDDPESIVRCTNKVYQAELFQRRGIPIPRTMVVHRDNTRDVAQVLGFPCVLKRPDSSFSLGVVKAESQDELTGHLQRFLTRSELIVAQEYVPSGFDWRIAVLDGRPLYACKYHMARGHWQIQKSTGERERAYGKHETLPIDTAPRRAVSLAVRAAGLVGDGFYGVDIKQLDNNRFVVIEVNDNPSVEAGVEDAVIKDDLYLAVMQTFYDRLQRRGREEQSRNESQQSPPSL